MDGNWVVNTKSKAISLDIVFFFSSHLNLCITFAVMGLPMKNLAESYVMSRSHLNEAQIHASIDILD